MSLTETQNVLASFVRGQHKENYLKISMDWISEYI